MPFYRQSLRFFAVFAALIVAAAAWVQAGDEPAESSGREDELLGVLRSDVPKSEKAIACKLLAIHGSSEAVPELARLLPDEQLASWARIALEAIPGPAADEALRKSIDSLTGKLLVGAINSIGVRRDAESIEPLTARLADADAEVASAAAVALGHIGNAAAAKSLRRLLASAPEKTRSAVAEGCVLCAERFFAEGQPADAVQLYDEVRKADVPKQRILEATRGAILSRDQKGIDLLVEQFRAPDYSLFQLGLSTAREFPGREVDKVMAAEMARAAPDRAALVIEAMADRKETVVLPAIVKAAERGPKQVRLAAVGALGRVGDVSCLSPLLQVALEGDADLTQTAKAALADLPDAKVDAEVVSRLRKAEGKMYPLLIEIVGQRRIEAIAELLKALDNADKTVRSAALTSLGATVPPKRLSVLISQVIAPKHPEDAPVAQQALRTASVRMPDREACAEELAMALERSPGPTKTTLLEILGDVAGTRALKAVGAAAKSDDPQLQDTGSRLLGKWNSIDAAPVLLDLAKTAPEDKYHVRAIKGYIGLARRFSNAMPEEQRLEMAQTAFAACRHPAEQKLVMDLLKLHPSFEGLKLAVKAMRDVPDLKDDATQAALVIAQKLGAKPEDAAKARELLDKAGLEKVKLEIVKAEYGADANQKDVTEALQKLVGDLPIITLASPGYNSSFGGDPAPNTPKKLKVQYKLNGKSGEITFAENALIIFPTPKDK
jgi:HEAT repeat protein